MGPIDALAPDGSYGRTSVYESYMRGQGCVSHPLRGLREDDMEGLCGYVDPFPEKIIREGQLLRLTVKVLRLLLQNLYDGL